MLQPRAMRAADQGLPKKEGAVRQAQPPKCDNSPDVFDRLPTASTQPRVWESDRTRFTNQESVQKRGTKLHIIAFSSRRLRFTLPAALENK
jgi:hypothetical protein